MSENKEEISWTAPEYIHYPKSRLWFGVLLFVGAGLIIYFLTQRDFLTALLFVLLLIVLFYFARKHPQTLHIHITHTGLKINNLKLPYQQIKSFWIVYDPPEVKTLNFETAAYLNRFLTLQLENEDPVQIRQFLLQFLSEDLDRGEYFTDKLSRHLKI